MNKRDICEVLLLRNENRSHMLEFSYSLATGIIEALLGDAGSRTLGRRGENLRKTLGRDVLRLKQRPP
ncbi:unnamed protein product [Colias eurytheme]|nr:unnamed protein product [Colias eurytheme]